MLEDPYEYRFPEPIRSRLYAIFMWLVVIGIVIAALVYASTAESEQLSPAGCAYAADVAITARALSEAGIERSTADKIIARMYVNDDPLLPELLRMVTNAAYASKKSPTDFSAYLRGACVGARGDMDKFLGVAI